MKAINNKLIELVSLLNDDLYHDGTTIGEKLNITRAAVWKLIKKLDQYGIPLISTKGKGYKLIEPLTLLDVKKITASLRHQSVKLHVLEKTPSTNEYLKSLTVNNINMIACLAETQTAGKGRLKRQWHSPFAQNIYLSLLCPFEKDISSLSGLSLVATLAACDAINRTLNFNDSMLTVKWPNDILINGRKLAGILVEIEAESNGFCQVIIGIGVNVNMQSASKKLIAEGFESLIKHHHGYIDRNELAQELIDTMIDYLERFSQKGFAYFLKEWQKKDCLYKRSISIVQAHNRINGLCLGINEQGLLNVKTEDGQIITCSSGDTSLHS